MRGPLLRIRRALLATLLLPGAAVLAQQKLVASANGRPLTLADAVARAQDGDTILSVDDAGQLFFQSAGSGCTGNGIASPHLDGNVNVYEVALTIASCDAPYTHLNGEFEGLATTTPGSYWDYDSFLRVWLSTSDPSAPPEAITMLAAPR